MSFWDSDGSAGIMVSSSYQRLPSRYYSALGRIVYSHLPDPQEFLERTGITAQMLRDPRGVITLAQLDALIEAASRVSGSAHLGLELGRHARLTEHGPLGYALLCSGTLDEMLRLAARYYHLIVPVFKMIYERRGSLAEITFMPNAAMPRRTLHFFVEALAVSFQVQLDGVLGADSDGYEIYLSTDAPADVHRLLGNRFVRFRFGQRRIPGVTVKLATSSLDKPLPMANRPGMTAAAAQCEAIGGKQPDNRDLVKFVEMMLHESEGILLTRSDVAASLKVTVRTLNRHLSNQGVTFRDVVQRARFAQACALLEEGNMTISQIASRLGFSEVSNFSRWFRQYTGVSPTRYANRYEPDR